MSNCSCIRGIYNFHVQAIDTKIIIYQDLSDWMDDDGYSKPDTYLVKITPPRKFNSIDFIMKVDSTNRIDSSKLGKLLDGIYCFEAESCGVSYKKNVGIYPNIACCLKKAFLKDYEKALEVKKHLHLFVLNVELGFIIEADKNLKIAKKLLDNIKCDCDC